MSFFYSSYQFTDKKKDKKDIFRFILTGESGEELIRGKSFSIKMRCPLVRNDKSSEFVEFQQTNFDRLNAEALIENTDLNMNNVVAHVKVSDRGLVTGYEWFAGPAFWHFNMKNPTLLPLGGSFDTQGNTLIRMAYKKFQMRLRYPELKMDTALLDPLSCGDVIFRKNRMKWSMMKSKSSNYSIDILAHLTLVAVHGSSKRFQFMATTCSVCKHGKAAGSCVFQICKTCCQRLGREDPLRIICPLHSAAAPASANAGHDAESDQDC